MAEQGRTNTAASSTQNPVNKVECPYLDTVNRNNLDFDFEKVCSVTLQTAHIYGCLVCGKYFQGRGVGTQAHMHSFEADHHVFISLDNQKIYCLPDGYEVIDPSLSDIKDFLQPKYTPEMISRLDAMTYEGPAGFRSLTRQGAIRCLVGGGEYVPGFIGLNGLSKTGSFCALLQLLAHVPRLRDYFLCPPKELYRCEDAKVLFAKKFGELVRKMWSPHNYRAHVTPHEAVHALIDASRGKFQIGVRNDPLDLLKWMLNELSNELAIAVPSNDTAPQKPPKKKAKSKHGVSNVKRNNTIIEDSFMGQVEVTTLFRPDMGPNGENEQKDRFSEVKIVSSVKTPFLFLQLDLPDFPLYQDKSSIPQIDILSLLKKFDGKTERNLENGKILRYSITKLPKYLILNIKRFNQNNMILEKNPTIVCFPVKRLDFKQYIHPDHVSENPNTRYDLVASIKHEGEPESDIYSTYVRTRSVPEHWYEIQGLSVTETQPQSISFSEAYIQVYELTSV